MKEKLAVAFLLVVLALSVYFSSVQKCAHYDEPFQIMAGLYHLKYGDYVIEVQNPPFARMFSSFPLLFINVNLPYQQGKKWTVYSKYNYGKQFLYKFNPVAGTANNADRILLISRLQILGLSLLLGVLVFFWSKQLFGTNAGIFALVLYCFSPEIIAHSGIASTDLAVSLFMLLSMYLLWKYFNGGGKKYIFPTGIALGIALTTKFTAVLLLPVFFLIALFYESRLKNIKSVLLMFAVSLVAVAVVYRFKYLPLFFEGIKVIFGFMGDENTTTFLMGKYSNSGFREYYLIVFLIKSTIPVIILTAAGLLFHKKIPINWRDKSFLLVPAILLFVAASCTTTQIGLRYILPAYPMLFVYLSGIAGIKKVKSNKILTGAVILLLVWHAVSSIGIFPHYLSYFNELVGGPKNGYKHLVDSNLDWGQDLKFLKKYLDGMESNLVECYFGQGDTKYEGIKGQHILTRECSQDVDYLRKNRRDILAVSATYLRGIYIGDTRVFNWLKGRKPDAYAGYSILIYDITDDAESHMRLGEIFQYGVNNPEAARKEYERAKQIEVLRKKQGVESGKR